VTLTDAGPLIAIIDADEEDHVACMEALDQIVIPLVTTWPAFTEAMHLLARAGGIRAQQALWRLVQTDRLVIADLSPSAVDRSARLMDQYADRLWTWRTPPSSRSPKSRATDGSSPSTPTFRSIGSGDDSALRRSQLDDPRALRSAQHLASLLPPSRYAPRGRTWRALTASRQQLPSACTFPTGRTALRTETLRTPTARASPSPRRR